MDERTVNTWLDKAEELLAKARQMTTPEARQILISLAYGYMLMAPHAADGDARAPRAVIHEPRPPAL